MKAIPAVIVIVMLFVGILNAQAGGATVPGPPGQVYSITLPAVRVELKEGPDRLKVETNCAVCHSADYITMQPKFPKAQWTTTVNKMIKTFGAQISQEDAEKIINYLSTNYGTGN